MHLFRKFSHVLKEKKKMDADFIFTGVIYIYICFKSVLLDLLMFSNLLLLSKRIKVNLTYFIILYMR